MLIVARHGQTDLNAAGRVQGRLDPPLNDIGRAQAAAIARVLTGVTHVVSSGLQRAQDTAAAIGAPIFVDERWVELDFGELDGLHDHEISRSIWQQLRTDAHFRPPGGESQAEVFDRVAEACSELSAKAANEDVVVVSHVSAIKAAVVWATGGSRDTLLRMRLAQASISRIGFMPDGTPMLVSFNEQHHLGQS